VKKGLTLIEVLVVIAIIGIVASVIMASINKAYACGFWVPCEDNAVQEANEITTNLAKAIPVPQLQTSSERKNVAKRAEIFNNEEKISYIYLVSYGKVMAFYTVQGKVSSLRSYMTPVEQIVDRYGNPCTSGKEDDRCSSTETFVISAPDIDGTYGENVEGIFFFTTEGAYVEWKGEYMMSDQPLKLTTQPELVREIQ
jgi:prepilin-type N-terminal cleavage/methylation domain-containing protein